MFDAATALLDICHCNSYEGECAFLLEQAAHQGAKLFEQFVHISEENLENILHVKCTKIDGIWQAQMIKLLVDMYHLKKKYSKEMLAYLFHHAVADAIVRIAEQICKEQNTNQVALSGGTFINRIILSEVMCGLAEKGIQAYTNEKVPCGDGGIALGQMYLATFYKES